MRATSDASDVDAVATKTFVTGAGRCGECHEKMYDEWERSAHAKAASTPLYVAAKQIADTKECGARCHTPLASKIGPDGVASEGVTCDVCHTMREPKALPNGANFRLAIDDMVKFGPRCDLKDHYFHRMGCSPEHTTAEICGGCHWWERGSVPVFTEYKDWRDAFAKPDQSCQSCHMPKERAEIAVGSPVRDGVPHHGWLGIASDLRKRAIGLAVEAVAKDGGIGVTVAITNRGAGHFVPAGLPERRLYVHATIVDAAGKKLGDHEWWLGRELVDDSGAFAPFWKATKLGRDTRIAPNATWTDAWRAPTGGAALEVDVRYRNAAPELVKLLGVTDIVDDLLAHLRVPLASLPAKAHVDPPAAGKRSAPLKTGAKK